MLTKKDLIRLKCKDCVAYEIGSLTNCPMVKCPLWGVRLGSTTKTTRFIKQCGKWELINDETSPSKVRWIPKDAQAKEYYTTKLGLK